MTEVEDIVQFVAEVKKEENEQNLKILINEFLRLYTRNSAGKPFQCKCSRNHESLEQLRIHVRDNHRETRGLIRCSICLKEFGFNSDLARHIDYVHKNIKNNECPICKKQFAHGTSIDRHHKQVKGAIKC